MFCHAFCSNLSWFLHLRYFFFRTTLNCFSMNQGSKGNSLSTTKVGIRYVFILPSPNSNFMGL
uniref:Putative ovule protein n=1 Tax=Solanum chacoense TaxID=4108 RepID=A0A0V0HNT8_SOLCH